MTKSQADLLRKTLQVWQPRYKEDLKPEEAMELVGNVVDFLQILGEWDSGEYSQGKESKNNGPKEKFSS